MVQGRLPNDNPTSPNDVDIEIVVPFEAQNDLGINVGDVLVLDQGGPSGGWPSSKNVRAQVVGVANVPEQLTPYNAAFSCRRHRCGWWARAAITAPNIPC